MNELEQAINEMRNMRESYDVLATSIQSATDAQGKAQLAAAITEKGVAATIEDNMSAMATKVRQIPQQLNTRTSDFEQMIAPTPYMWNVYSVATDLMKDTLPDYFPAYMQAYKANYGTNAFFVGEYYLGYASLELSGADGYLTNDGDFYTISNGVVTHTKPNGTTETWEAESIVHTWHDDNTYCNRWVAFFYLNNAYSFTNINSAICPRRVALCGTCNSFVVSGENRLTDVWVIGELGHFEGGTTGDTWNPAQVIRHYRSHGGSYIYRNASYVVSVILPDMEYCTGDIMTGDAGKLSVIALPKNTSPGPRNLTGCSNIVYFLDNMSGDFSYANPLIVMGSLNNAVVKLPNLKNFTNTNSNSARFIHCSRYGAAKIYVDSIEKVSLKGNSRFFECQSEYTGKLKILYAPCLSGFAFTYLIYGNGGYFTDLEDIWIGEYSYNINLTYWTATNVTATAEGIAEINANIRNHIAARIKDMTGETSPTITFGANLYNNLEQSTKDAFAAKNWTVASA